MIKHNPTNYYEYDSGMIVCGVCLDEDLAQTAAGNFVEDEAVYQGMFKRLHDDDTEAYQCDGCGEQNEAYDAIGEEP